MKIPYLVLTIAFSPVVASADSNLDAAIGGGLGGAAGAAIGNEVGGRNGAILGGAIGAAAGAAVTTDDRREAPPSASVYVAPGPAGPPRGYHCPPGLRKQGRC
jgi:hypothetical protein